MEGRCSQRPWCLLAMDDVDDAFVLVNECRFDDSAGAAVLLFVC